MLVLRDRAFKFVSFGTNLHRLTNWVHYQHCLGVTGSSLSISVANSLSKTGSIIVSESNIPHSPAV